MMRFSMTRRLALWLTAALGTLWLAGVTFAAFSIRHELDEVFDSALQETAQRILPLAADDLAKRNTNDAHPSMANPALSEADHEEYLHYQVRDQAGRVLLRSHDAPSTPFRAPLTRGFHDDGVQRYYTELSSDGRLAVQVAELPEERQEAVVAIWVGLLTPLLGLLPLAVVIIAATVRRAIAPVRALQREIRARDGSNLEAIAITSLPSELAPIVGDMNRLLARLDAALEAERGFAANSAHELRNPLAAARAQAELLAQAASTDPDRERAGQLVAMLQSISRKIEKMLQLARAEAGIGLSRETTDLAEVTRLMVDEYARKPNIKGRLHLTYPTEPVLVAMDPDGLGIAIQNLLDNALKHGPANTEIAITIEAGPSLTVASAGPALPPAELARLRGRFARGAATTSDGAGLGLAIVDTIMRHAGGSLELSSPAPGRSDGFEAALHFPAKKSVGLE